MILSLIRWAKEKVQGKKPQVSRSEVLVAIPVKNPLIEWERVARKADDTESVPTVLMKIPRRKDKMGNLAAKIFRLPDFRKLELDEIGSDVWELCDGTHTVEAIIKALGDKYKMNRRQTEASVTAFLKMLAERRLVALKTGRAVKSAKQTGGSTPRKQKRA